MKIEDTNKKQKTNITNFNIESYIPIIEKNSYPMFNLMTRIKIPSNINPVYYVEYSPKQNESFQSISYKFYNTIKLWWLICATNNIFNATSGAIVQTRLKIIKPEFVQTILSELGD